MQQDGSASTMTATPKGGEGPGGTAVEGALEESPKEAPSCPSKEEVVARLFEAFSRRDLPSALALLHPEVVFQPMTAAVTRAGEPYRGHEGVLRYAEDVETHWVRLTIRPKQIRSAGRAVVALGLVSGSGPGGSFEDAPTTWVVKFKDSLVVQAQIFSDERNVVSALVGEDA
jgi:ketosteroid isomerase-like protein